MKRWSYSLMLLVMYLAVFHAWMHLSRTGIIQSGVVVTIIAMLLFLNHRSRGYFRDGWDQFAHGAVILDILLEAIFIPYHDDLGFYWCASGFAIVIVGYRSLRTPVANELPQ
ncbi:MAG: hypothetical protein ACPGVU_13255 [Limisphaerales bacterium]